MKNFALLTFFITVSLFAVAFIVSRYRTANPLQRRQIVFGAVGAFVVATGLFCVFALSHAAR